MGDGMAEAEQSGILPRIGLAATDEVRIAGFRAVLTDGAGLDVVLLNEPGALERSGVEMVLIDASSTEHLPGLLEAFRRARPNLRLIVLGGAAGPEFIEQTIVAGARGVLSHDATEAELLMAVKVVGEGSVWAPRKVLSRLLDRANEVPPAPAEIHLTNREREVLRLLVLGLSNREISHALGVEQAAVKAHLGRLMRKAGVSNRTALGMRALDSKWV